VGRASKRADTGRRRDSAIGKIEAENASIDFYTFLRSDYYQTRRPQSREALGLPAEVESRATGPSR
jgi:ABC-type transporter lipoprotein component MlaA